MENQTKFSHITVAPADDEVVILAGAVPDSSEEGNSASASSGSEQGCAPVRGASKEADKSRSVASAQEPSAGDGSKAKATQAKASKSAEGQLKDSYSPTTLEDINSSKMPKTQIVVIAMAVVAIVVFAVWNVAFS